mmetsp:Transcript_14922/g.22228  ORF Transcript_14922/g.22228 Transcript_14922/m.22228 type:complete len:101 (+) Transcript_14922:75-377(+)
MLAMDADRQEKGKLDVICCIKSSSQVHNDSNASSTPSPSNQQQRSEPGESSMTGKLFKNYYLPFLLSNMGIAFGMIFTLGLLALSIYGITEVNFNARRVK